MLVMPLSSRADITTNVPGQTQAQAPTKAAPAAAPTPDDPAKQLSALATALKAEIDKVMGKLATDIGPMKNVKVNISTISGRALVSADNDKKGPVTFLLVTQDDGSWAVGDYFVPFDIEAAIKGKL